MSHAKRSRAMVIVLTFVAIALPFFVSEFLGESGLHEVRFLRFLSREFWYQEFGPAGPRQSRIGEFKIVVDRALQPGSILGENRCTHREFMATLLTKVPQFDPRLIVVDKWYNHIPPGVCTGPRDGTADLAKAIRTISSKTPLVIGVESFTKAEVGKRCADLDPEALKSDELVLADYEPLNQNLPENRVILGLARINEDERKVSLGWPAFPGCNLQASSPKIWPTIATAAASLLDPNILGGGALTQEKLKRAHPFTKLLRENRFDSISAISLVCNQTGQDVDWNKCGEAEGDQQKLSSLLHKVVIIGEKQTDQHSTSVGNVSGAHLQANYVAALLDGGVLNPAPAWVNWSATFAWLVLLVWIFYGWKPKFPLLAAGISVVMTFVLGVLCNEVITRQFGIFADVVPPTILEIIGLYLARKIELLVEQHKESAGVSKKVAL